MTRLSYRFNVEMLEIYLENAFLAEREISTSKQLARHIGLHEKTLSRIFTGKSNFSVKTAKKIHKIVPEIEFSKLFIRV